MANNSTAISYPAQAATSPKNLVVVLGRVFFAAIFVISGLGHFSNQTIGYGASQGVPLASIAVPFSRLVAMAGGLIVLLGYGSRRCSEWSRDGRATRLPSYGENSQTSFACWRKSSMYPT